MREIITIPLAKPLVTQAGSISQIVLREPSFDEYLQYGDPYVVAGAKDGTPFGVENVDVIRQYLSVCLVEPKDPALLSQAGARVAREVKDKLLSFFQPAAASDKKLDAAPETSGTSSLSAGSASVQEKSAG